MYNLIILYLEFTQYHSDNNIKNKNILIDIFMPECSEKWITIDLVWSETVKIRIFDRLLAGEGDVKSGCVSSDLQFPRELQQTPLKDTNSQNTQSAEESWIKWNKDTYIQK